MVNDYDDSQLMMLTMRKLTVSDDDNDKTDDDDEKAHSEGKNHQTPIIRFSSLLVQLARHAKLNLKLAK